MRDSQRSKVYAWENQFLNDGYVIPFDQIKDYIAKIWETKGLKFPPLLVPLSKNSKKLGMACRNEISLPETGATELTILHELAHSMTSTVQGASERHGATFVGVYMDLVSTFLDKPLFEMWHTARLSGVQFDHSPTPTIVSGLVELADDLVL